MAASFRFGFRTRVGARCRPIDAVAMAPALQSATSHGGHHELRRHEGVDHSATYVRVQVLEELQRLAMLVAGEATLDLTG
jgi:hypothetical protein